MTPDDAFLQAIREAPDDDVPRMQYAEWLSERGVPRGEFIFLQIELARIPQEDSRRRALEERERELLQERRKDHELTNQEEWEKLLTDRGVNRVRWSRGFPEGITMHPRAFLGNAEAIFKDEPTIRSLTLRGMELMPQEDRVNCLKALANCQQLWLLTHLNLTNNDIGNVGLRILSRSLYLDNLAELDLTMNKIGYPGAAALADCASLGRLAHLDLSYNSIGDQGVASLAITPQLGNLTTLYLPANEITDQGALAMATSRQRRGLTYLDLHLNEIGLAGALALAESEHLPNLEDIGLLENPQLRDAPDTLVRVELTLAAKAKARGGATATRGVTA